MNKIIEEIIKNNIPVLVEYDKEKDTFVYIIQGFYKSCDAKLIYLNGELNAYTRYDRVDRVDSLRDIVWLNFDWWNSSKDNNVFESPDNIWKSLLISEGFIKEHKEIITTYKIK